MDTPRCRVASTSLWQSCRLTIISLACVCSVAWSSSANRGSRHLRARYLQDSSSSACTIECCTQFEETLCGAPENDWINVIPFGVQIILIILLVMISATFSGLTLGFLGLDMTGLEIVMGGDDFVNAQAAKRIYPVRKNGNRLLCTLILGNVATNALLSILLADKAGGLVGFFSSTIIIVIFGEIIPQAVCARYALEIGSRTVPLVKVIMVLFLPIAGPLGFFLNKALGNELATTYSSAEMRKLLEIHVQEGRFDQETAGAMAGALQYKNTLVKDVMTPLEHTYMLNIEDRLNFETIATIFKKGYSRIPVYDISVNNIIGLLFVKDLIFVDPEDETPVRNFVQIFGRGFHVVWPDDKLGEVLRELKKGRSHMALVRDVNNVDETQDPFYEIKGIITLEDIIEEILGDEIVDETDAFVDGTHSVKVDRLEHFDWGRLRLLDSKIVDASLSHEEAKAVTAHLRTNYNDAFSLLSDNQLHRLVSETAVTELPAAMQEVGCVLPKDRIYAKGVPTNVCTLLLSGKVIVHAGADCFRSDVSSWSVLAPSALIDSTYSPDFTAYVSSGPCRCLRFTRERYTAAVDASAIEKVAEGRQNEMTAVLNTTIEGGREPSLDSNYDRVSETDSSNGISGKPKGSTQARRNKLIDAFQKAKNSHDDDDVPQTIKTDETRTSSVRFFSSSVGLSSLLADDDSSQPKLNMCTKGLKQVLEPCKSENDKEEKVKRGGSRSTAIEYIGSQRDLNERTASDT